jgi:hypothetical protein
MAPPKLPVGPPASEHVTLHSEPREVDTVSLGELRAADVLLYRGRSFVSRAICLLDGTSASHAGLYLGDGQVGEAVGRGLVRNALADSCEDHDWVQVRRIKATPLPDVSPILHSADAYLDARTRYAYQQIVLLAFLCLTRRLNIPPLLDRLVRRTVDAAAGYLNELLGGGKQLIICSEFVYRCYADAERHERYALHINDSVHRQSYTLETRRHTVRGTSIHLKAYSRRSRRRNRARMVSASP